MHQPVSHTDFARAMWQRQRSLPLLPLLAATLLTGCETAPRAGTETRAQVVEVLRERQALRDGQPELHPALRAGVTAQAIEAGRLVQGECAEPDATRPQGLRWTRVTALLPVGTTAGSLAPGSVIEVREPRPAWPAGPGDAPPAYLHGQFAGSAAGATDAAPTPTLCHPAGQAASVWRVRLRGAVPGWAHPFAQAGLQRLEAFSDDDVRAGRVVRLTCQLKVADGGDWYAPVWIARAPERLPLRVGDVVRLRAGAEASSKDAGPAAEVLARDSTGNAPGGNAVVRCR
jgi:predicted small secreted protein